MSSSLYLGIGITLMGVVSPMYYPTIEPYAIYILSLGIAFIIVPLVSLAYRWLQKKKLIFANDFTSKNNPDHFPALNENALKDHMSLIVNDQSYPLNGLIEKITLYKGVEEKYVLVVKIGLDEKHFASHLYIYERKHPYFLEFMNHWQPDSLRFLAHKNFGAEVYRSGYSSDLCLLNDWLIWVQPLNEELPDDEIIIEKYNWLLFRKKMSWYIRAKQQIKHITNHWS